VQYATVFVFFLIACFLALNLILVLFIGGIAFVLGNQLIVQILQVPQVGDDSQIVLLLSALGKLVLGQLQYLEVVFQF